MEDKKMTKRDFFTLIKEEMKDNQAVVDFCNREIDLLDKKKASGSKKANEQVSETMEKIYDALVEINRPVTATELIATKSLDGLANDSGMVTTQKVSYYLNKLVETDRIESYVDKKKKYFKVKEEEND